MYMKTTECEQSKACAPSKHHFDECVERVTAAKDEAHDKKHPNEDCVEECMYLHAGLSFDSMENK